LDGQSVIKEALESTNYTEIKETVAATPEAVGIVPVSTTDATVRIIENDAPLNTPINAVTIGKPSAKVRKLLDYIRGEGKSHIRQ
ncbi:MAG TPA: phosphate ABC transporter substrate-binding protein, partial [Accumulibacter sp.]|nr:phosphate ABC transporter substrate-binding protein [Accumulibacter sp.]